MRALDRDMSIVFEQKMLRIECIGNYFVQFHEILVNCIQTNNNYYFLNGFLGTMIITCLVINLNY